MAQKNMVTGMANVKHAPPCEHCVVSKQTRTSFPSGMSRRASSCLQLVHIDLCGPMSEVSLGNNKYFFLIVDDYSRWCWVYFLKCKFEAFHHFKLFHAMVERQTGKKLKAVRSDRGGEFTSLEFQKYCEGWGIKRELTVPYTPQQNGVVEHKNMTVVEMARSLLKCGGLPLKF